MGSVTMRVADHVHAQSKQLAGLNSLSQSELVGKAWDEYVENHREEFAAGLEALAGLIRNGTVSELGDYLGADDRTERANEYVDSLTSRLVDHE